MDRFEGFAGAIYGAPSNPNLPDERTITGAAGRRWLEQRGAA
jgi:hypothetical protein